MREARAQSFDLLISDIGLPDGSGLDLIRKLLAERPIKGIALSGYGMEEDIQRSREAGFEEHLTKPINLQKLEATIQRVADGAK
jgi:CheY-like chemotaxis protein